MKLRRLTRGQFRVISLLWHEAMNYHGIADRLGISVRTVRMHIEHVARDLPGNGPPAWRVLRHAEELLEMGFSDETPREKAS